MTFKTESAVQVAETMECMEVCGGHGERRRHLRRPGLDVWVNSQAKLNTEAGGGDLHLISSCASGRITRILLADVCGYGPLFHEMADRLRDIIKRNVNSIRQTSSVRQMSELLAGVSQDGGFASVLMNTYFAPTRSFTVCNAGHPPPMLYRSRTREWWLMKQSPEDSASTDQALGVVHPDDYHLFKTTLERGDVVLEYSNSLSEGRDRAGHTIGVSGLLDRVRQLDAETPAAIPDQLLQVIRDEHPENLADDDATIIVCHATNTPVPWKDSVLAPLRLLRSVSDQTSFE